MYYKNPLFFYENNSHWAENLLANPMIALQWEDKKVWWTTSGHLWCRDTINSTCSGSKVTRSVYVCFVISGLRPWVHLSLSKPGSCTCYVFLSVFCCKAPRLIDTRPPRRDPSPVRRRCCAKVNISSESLRNKISHFSSRIYYVSTSHWGK